MAVQKKSPFSVMRSKAVARLRPNQKNVFILSKWSADGKNITSKAEQYVSMLPIEVAGNYRLTAYLADPATKNHLEGSMFAEFGVFAMQNEDDPDDVLPIYAVSFEFIKCPACFGAGYFKKPQKLLVSDISRPEGKKLAGKVGQGNYGSKMNADTCWYMPAAGKGCDGTGINKSLVDDYNAKLAALFEFDKKTMQEFLKCGVKEQKEVKNESDQDEFQNPIRQAKTKRAAT
jgi:hypothetical protein